MLGLTWVQKESYVTLCMCRLTLAWITSENSTTLLECRLIFPHCGWTLSHPTGLSAVPCLLVTHVTLRQLLPRAPLSNSLTGHSRSPVQNPLSGFAPKQTKELSAWRTTYIVLHIHCWLNIANITPHGPDDGSVEPKRYSWLLNKSLLPLGLLYQFLSTYCRITIHYLLPLNC